MDEITAPEIAAVARRLSDKLVEKSRSNEPVTLAPDEAADLATVLRFLADGWHTLEEFA